MRVSHSLIGVRLTVLLATLSAAGLTAKVALADPASQFGVAPDPNGTRVQPLAPTVSPSGRPFAGGDAPANVVVRSAPGDVVVRSAPANVVVRSAPANVVVRSGNHPGFGRLVFDLPNRTDVVVEQNGETITLHFGEAELAKAVGVSLPRNVREINANTHDVTFSIAAGSHLHSSQTSTQLVIDILDPKGATSGEQAPNEQAKQDSAPPTTPARVSSGLLEDTSKIPHSVAAENATPKLPAVTGMSRAVEAFGSDLGASEPPAAPTRGKPTVEPVKPVSSSRDSAASRAPGPAMPIASLPNAAVKAPLVSPPGAAPNPVPGQPSATQSTATQGSATQGSGLAAVAPTPASPKEAKPGAAELTAPQPKFVPAEIPSASPPQSAQTPKPNSMAAGTSGLPAWAGPPGAETPDEPAWALPPPVSSAQPVHTTAARIPVAAGSQGAAISLPFPKNTGAAAVRRGEGVVLVFDENRPIDLSPLKGDPVFGEAAIQLLEGATILRLNVPAGADLRLTASGSGWTVWVGPVGDAMDVPLQTLASAVSGSQMQFAAAQPGKVIIVPDPETGANLLVGTQLQAGQAVPTMRRTPDFALLPSLLGVIVEPASDRPQLQVAAPGFVLSSVARPLALSPNTTTGTATADAAALSRRFDLQALPTLMLRQRLKNRIDEDAAAPPLARLPKRRATAEAYLALGMGAEAQAMMRLAVTDDPRGGNDPDTIALGSMAALLAQRTQLADAIDDPRLSGTDEIRLWRAIRGAQLQEGSHEAAADFAATDRLVLSYPDLLRDHLIALVAETEVLGGQVPHAVALLEKRPDDPHLILARAFVLRAQGNAAGALAVFDKLARGSDRLLRFRASMAAIELRLATKAITPTQAADAAEKLLYAWRGDDRERALRFQIAAWRFQAGQWRAALAMLRESAAAFPELRNQYRRQITETLRGLMRDDRLSSMDSIELISLLEDNVDLLPDGAEGNAAATQLADRMALLDLDQRAEPILQRLASTAPSLPARAAFGLRLAVLRLDNGDTAGALTALSTSASDGLGPDLIERRAIVAARADAAAGRLAQAVASLIAIGTPGADLVRATLQEQAKDWAGAEAALSSYVSQTVPPEGPLTPDQSHAILRLAAATEQARDETGLAGLRGQFGVRIANTQDGPAFRVLSEAPVRDVTDLPRSAKELSVARSVASQTRP
jgi:hypothetical protein